MKRISISIRFTNLNDPSQPCTLLSNRRLKILPNRSIKKQSLENIQYSSDTPYTSQLIVQAIENALKKAETTK